jgi:hypothetical protein
MASRLEMLQTLRARLEAEHLQAVEWLATSETPIADAPVDRIRRLADLHGVLCAVRDEIARHAPRMGYGPDTLSLDEAASNAAPGLAS